MQSEKLPELAFGALTAHKISAEVLQRMLLTIDNELKTPYEDRLSSFALRSILL